MIEVDVLRLRRRPILLMVSKIRPNRSINVSILYSTEIRTRFVRELINILLTLPGDFFDEVITMACDSKGKSFAIFYFIRSKFLRNPCKAWRSHKYFH